MNFNFYFFFIVWISIEGSSMSNYLENIERFWLEFERGLNSEPLEVLRSIKRAKIPWFIRLSRKGRRTLKYLEM